MALQRQAALLTAEDIRDWPDDYELYDGVPRSVAAAPDVSAIGARIVYIVSSHVVPRNMGVVFGADASFRLIRASDRQAEVVYLPDAAFVTAERAWQPGAMTYPFEGAPDLAVEVRSPSQSMAELDQKMHRYLDAGLRLGWLVDPAPRGVIIYRPDEPPRRVEIDAVISGENVLPGFQVSVSAFFDIGGPIPQSVL